MFKKLGIGCLGIVVVVVVLGIVGAIFGNNNNKNSNSSFSTKVEQNIDKKAISDEIIQILSEIPQEQDEVEHQINYKSWGTDKIPAQTALYWSVSLKDDNLSKIKIQVVHFTSDTEWVFWDNMIFSNGDNKWEKKLNTFAGQSGDGKSTQIVMGGKYETWQGPLTDVREGIEVLTNGGGKPILRLSGKYKDDVYPSAEDIQRMKTALRLQTLLEQINYKLVR